LRKSSNALPKGVTDKFREALENFREATPLLAENHKKRLMSSLDLLTDSKEGLQFLYDHIDELINAGIFRDTMWDDPARLVPALVGGTLKAGDQNTIVEMLSELRLVAIANGSVSHKGFSAGKARTFLEEALVSNLDLIFPSGSEEIRSLDDDTRRKIDVLFQFLTDQVSVDRIKGRLAKEIELICAQRPVVTDRVLGIIKTVKNEIELTPENEDDRRLNYYVNAVYTPSEKAGEFNPDEYQTFLEQASRKEIIKECEGLAETMHDTGLSVGYHAILLRHVASDAGLVKMALGLDNVGKAELDKHKKFVNELIRKVIYPDTARSCYGLAKLLERSLLSHQPVKSGLQRIMGMELHSDVAANIRKSRPGCSLDPKHILTAECLGILGQPLGVGQGWNPTCQSARGISLWSSHAPGKLLRMIESAAKSNSLWMRFEGNVIKSEELVLGLVKELDYNLGCCFGCISTPSRQDL
jgi:hypothetical protein